MARAKPDLARSVGAAAPRLLAVIAVVVVGVVTGDLINGQLPIVSRSGGTGPGPAITPTPSNVVLIPPDPRAKVPGTIVYVKSGNLWLQSGSVARQLTTGGQDSMPTFSADGRWIYFIRTHTERGQYVCGGGTSLFTMSVPAIMRVPTDASGPPAQLASGKFGHGSSTWFYFLRQPVPSPDGTQLAVMSDAPNPCSSDVVLHFFNLSSHRLVSAHLGEESPLGHQDPAWSPSGASLLYTRNARAGALGAPVIYKFVLKSGTATALTGPGYLQPAVSPDGRYVAVTHLDATGSDVAVLDATNGHELLRITSDDASAAPIWSPAGDSIAYFHTASGITDLELVNLSGSAPNWTASAPIQLTELAGLDPGSRPSWFIPANQLPTPPPSVTQTP